MQKSPRDVVVVRVSEQGDREDDNFHSPKAQLAKAKLWSEDQGNRVVNAFEEIDVSGKLPFARRPGLLQAIEMVEAGEADHIVVAYFDRLVRSLKVQLEVIERVEQAGGEIYAIDHGRLTNGTAATRMSNNMMGAAFQYYAEVTGEKVQAAQERVVARAVLPNSRISPGYVRGADGVLVVERPTARIVVQAFKRRDRGASLVEIQALLAANGIERACTFRPADQPLARATIEVMLSRSDGLPDRSPIAWSLTPLRLSHPSDVTTHLKLGVMAQFVEASVERTQERASEEVFLEALGLQESKLGWEFWQTASESIRGTHRLAAVLRIPVPAEVRGEVRITASVRNRRFGATSYRAVLPAGEGIAFTA